VIKLEIMLDVPYSRSATNSSCAQIDSFHLRFDNPDVTKNAPEWVDNVRWVEISRGNLVQQWREQNEVFPADQQHFYIGAAGNGFVQVSCCVKASKAAARNDNPLLHTST
jgi:hypothetical protein